MASITCLFTYKTMQKLLWLLTVYGMLFMFCGYVGYCLWYNNVVLVDITPEGGPIDRSRSVRVGTEIPRKSAPGPILDIGYVIKGISRNFAVKKPLVPIFYNVTCSNKTRSFGDIEDILCMPPPVFLQEYKNPCWYSEDQKFNCLPYFQLIGGAKCASSDLFDRIISHPDILGNTGARNKETMWWALTRYGIAYNGDTRSVKTFEDYLNFFNSAATMIKNNPFRGYITGDGSPHDLVGNLGWKLIPQNQGLKEPQFITPHLIRHMNPDVKIIIILRDPVERLFSDYVFRSKNASAEEFHHRVLRSLRLLRICTLTNSLRTCVYDRQLYKEFMKLKVRPIWGFYAIYLQDWFQVFPRDQILILQTEEYSENMTKQLDKVFNFLGVHPLSTKTLAIRNRMYVTKNKQEVGDMHPKTRQILRDLYSSFNKRLVTLLGEDRWNKWIY